MKTSLDIYFYVIVESEDFKTALEVVLQFFPRIKLKRENRNCALKARLSNETDVLLRFLSAWDIRLVNSSSSSGYWSENKALFVEGLR